MVDERRFFAHGQFYRCHGRLVTQPVFLTQRVIGRTDGVFACCKSGKIAVFKSYGSVCGYRIISTVKKCVTVIQRRHGIAVKADTEGNIRAVKLCKADCFGDRLGIGVDHHAFGIDNGNVVARIRHTQVYKCFPVRLDIKARAAVRKRKLRPVADNRVLILKRSLGKQIFNLFKSAAVIRCGYRHRLRLFEEQTEGDRVHKGIEFVRAYSDFRCGRSNIRNAENGDDNIARHG